MGAEVKSKVGLVGATSFVTGTIIGSGIFITANTMMLHVGSWAITLVIWALSGLAALAGSLCFAELATIFPKQGGTYIFIKEGLGDLPSFIYIYIRILLLNPCAAAVQSLACAKYLLAPLSSCLPSISLQFMSIAITMFITFLHCYSTQVTSKLNTGITTVKVSILFLVVIIGLVNLGVSQNGLDPPLEGLSFSASSYVSALYGGYWSYAGWQGIPAVCEDIKDVKKNLPRAIVGGIILVMCLYVMVNFAFISVLSNEEIKTTTLVAETFASKIAGPYLSTPLVLLVSLSLFGSLIGSSFLAGRWCFSASRENHVPRFISLLHRKANTPVTGQMLHSAISIIMIMTTTRIGILLKLFVFVSIGFDLLVLMSFFRIKFKKFFNLNFPEASIHVPVIVPILYSAYLIFMVITPIIKDQDVKLLIPLCVIALTGLLHFLFVRKKVGHGFNFGFAFETFLCNLLDLEHCQYS